MYPVHVARMGAALAIGGVIQLRAVNPFRPKFVSNSRREQLKRGAGRGNNGRMLLSQS
jgi:hypothetical protein